MKPNFARVRKLRIQSDKLIESLLSGNYRSVFKGPGLEFAEVREYVEGDDPRLIDWNVSSRMGSVFTKTFREERELVLFLVIDTSASMRTGNLLGGVHEAAATICALLAIAATNNNDRVGATLFSDSIEQWISPGKGRKHAMRIIQAVFDHQARGTGSDLALALRTTGEALKRRGICVVVSDFKTSDYFRDLSLLSRRHDVIAVRVTNPVDTAFPDIGLVRLVDPETQKTVVMTGQSAKTRAALTEFWELQRNRWFRECVRRGVSPLEISAQDDVAERLVAFFRRRKGT